MKTNRKSLLKILSLGLVFALMTVFLFFAGCANNSSPAGNEKSGTDYENPEASEYGVFTKLTLTLDCGDGKVWATVKNTFTVLPSAVRVSVELYKSESYKPDYKEMELASENSVEDLDIFQTLTTEAPAGDKTYFWQARMYYRIDDGEWQESLSKVMAINSEGKIVITVGGSETPSETFCLKDLVKGDAENLFVYEIYKKDGERYAHKGDGLVAQSLEVEENNRVFDLIKNSKCEYIGVTYGFSFPNCDHDLSGKLKYGITIFFKNGMLDLSIGELGCVHGSFFDSDQKKHIGFKSQENSFDSELVYNYLENIIKNSKENQND